uniref:Secreted protein n=1 Tax=Araneus ventricosus TaxID=182803 RepID=A0A4Y2CUQ2_ARAVE|nr:hypothetical protein AVEN_20876-1 [Araneus ventricosus]GBM07377.1 hypothetical protein AVEN_137635-1 [Araneus ventricosus]GBM07418.1 hypothetical protein AVEN_185523-1 [Araneus ventricosus]
MRNHRISKRVLAFLVGIVMVGIELPPLQCGHVPPIGEIGPLPVMAMRYPPQFPRCRSGRSSIYPGYLGRARITRFSIANLLRNRQCRGGVKVLCN